MGAGNSVVTMLPFFFNFLLFYRPTKGLSVRKVVKLVLHHHRNCKWSLSEAAVKRVLATFHIITPRISHVDATPYFPFIAEAELGPNVVSTSYNQHIFVLAPILDNGTLVPLCYTALGMLFWNRRIPSFSFWRFAGKSIRMGWFLDSDESGVKM